MPCERAHRKLLHHRVGATYPSLHRLHVRSLHAHDLGVIPYRSSDARCDGAQALDHHVRQEVLVNRLRSRHIQEMIQTFLKRHRYRQSCREIHQALDRELSSTSLALQSSSLPWRVFCQCKWLNLGTYTRSGPEYCDTLGSNIACFR